MADSRIEIVVSGDNAKEIAREITAALGDHIPAAQASQPPPGLPELISKGLATAEGLPDAIMTWWRAVEASTGFGPANAFAVTLLLLAAAYVVERAVALAMPGAKRPRRDAVPEKLAQIAAGLRWAAWRAVSLLLFYLLTYGAISVTMSSGAADERIAFALLDAVATGRAWLILIGALAAPGAPERRITGLEDREAFKVLRLALIGIPFLAATQFLRDLIVSVVAAGESGAMAAACLRAADGLVLIVLFAAIRKPVARLLLLAFASGGSGQGVAGVLIRNWHLAYSGLVALQVSAQARSYLLLAPDGGSFALQRSFSIFVILPFMVAGLGVWRDQLLLRSDLVRRGRILGFFALLEGAAVVGSLIAVLYAWDLDPLATNDSGARRFIPGLVAASIIIAIGVAIWRTLDAFLEADNGTAHGDAEALPDDEGGGVGRSRYATILPVARAMLFAMIGTITVLLALSSLGVQIGPLLAGAGIAGLAIGFGAQKMVADFISGVLYLTEDAFRIGEYVETACGKGSVEKIMLRSVRLRHHRGSVYTIPFSSLGAIQNHSRDWVKVKFNFEVAPTEDLERVRKLIKKVGLGLAEDPELAGKFLEPLKSQGAVAMVGQNYLIGVKFTCRPGEQFLIRRKAMNAMQRAIEENGIAVGRPQFILESASREQS